MAETLNKYGLDKTSRKFKCPGCNHRSFVRMMDFEANDYLPEHVGRCDRESNCGYHYTVKQYLKDNGMTYTPPTAKEPEFIEPEKVDLMPGELILQSLRGFEQSNFALYLISLFGHEIATKTLEKYCIGRAKADNGKACIFWNVDNDYKIRTGKIICYNPLTGKRNKDIVPTMVHKTYNKDFNLKLTFFGAHLLDQCPDKTIGLVESEKTAIIASIYMPDMIWLATGGASGCKWREYSVFNVLKDRNIILFPDFGYFNKKTLKTCYQEWTERALSISERMPCTIKVSRVLEDNLSEEERVNDFDLADMLVKRDNGKGWALTDAISEELPGYPVMWDLYKNITNN
ncbi:MAG: hypothetical protein JWQ09_2975 [Segetibacter sp.]|nr:hypothetical protein [Segetibacter sp.]